MKTKTILKHAIALKFNVQTEKIALMKKRTALENCNNKNNSNRLLCAEKLCEIYTKLISSSKNLIF